MDQSRFVIRPAVRPDAGEMAVLLCRSISELCVADHNNDETCLQPWFRNKTEETALAWIDGPSDVFVAEEADALSKLIGVAMGTQTGEVVLNYVHPEARFRGVSKALMKTIECTFLAQGISRVRLKSTKTAENFYLSIGYELIERPTEPGNRASAVFEKDLSS